MKMMKRILVLCLVAALCVSTLVFPARAAVFGAAEANAYLDQLYGGLLGRTPDESGRASFVNSMVNQNASAANVAQAIVGSAEFRSRPLDTEGFITAMYRGLLGREPDASGMATYKAAIEVGQSRTWVFQQIIGSQEFKNLCENVYNMHVGDYSTTEGVPNVTPTGVNSLKAEEYVVRLYKRLLDREPDAAGLEHWVLTLTMKQSTPAGVAASMAGSPEFNAKSYTDAQFVQRAYLALLGREPDAAGFTDFVSALNAGKSRAWVFASICASKEFQGQFSDITRLGDMNTTPGTVNPSSDPAASISGAAVNRTMAEDYVERLYLCFLNRYCSDTERDGWVNQLVNRTMSAAGVAAGIAASAEAVSPDNFSTREVFVDRVYQALLNRSPDVVGMGSFVNALANGYSRAWVFAKICESTEFQNRSEFRDMNVVAGKINAAAYDMG